MRINAHLVLNELNGVFLRHVNLFVSGFLILDMSRKSFSDIIKDTLHIDFSFGDPSSASNPCQK